MTLSHDDTRARARGLDATLQRVLERVSAHGREIAIGIAVLLVVGIAVAVAHEMQESSQEAGSAALEAVERELARDMGAESAHAFLPEPANEAQARAAREKAAAGFERVRAEYGSTKSGTLAGIRRAELLIELGREAQGVDLLAELAEGLEGDDPMLAIALRVRAWGLERLGRDLEAAEAYERGAGVQEYLAASTLWLAAGDAFGRVGEVDRALAAYDQVLSRDAELAEREGLQQRMSALQSRPAAPQP